MPKKPRKTRSDKGKKRTKPYNKGKKRKRARPHRVKGFDRGGPLRLGSLAGDEKGFKPGTLFTKEDKRGIPLGSLSSKKRRKK